MDVKKEETKKKEEDKTLTNGARESFFESMIAGVPAIPKGTSAEGSIGKCSNIAVEINYNVFVLDCIGNVQGRDSSKGSNQVRGEEERLTVI